MADIYVLRDDKQFGPYERETITLMLEEGQFSSSDYFWRDGMAEWRPLAELSAASANSVPQLKKQYPPRQKPTPLSLTPALTEEPSSTEEPELKKDWRSRLSREVSPGWKWILGGLLTFIYSFCAFAPGVYGVNGKYPPGDFTPGELRDAKRGFGCSASVAAFFYGIIVVVGGGKKKK